MPISFNEFLNCGIYSNNEKVGTLDDILFNDDTWKIRYLVVRFREDLLKIKRVLIHTNALSSQNWQTKKIHLNISQEQLANQPTVDADKPVFRQMEEKYFDFYKWPYYWDDMGIFGIDPRAYMESKKNRPYADPNLRSSRIIRHYTVRKNENKIGLVTDIIFSVIEWKVLFLTARRNLLSPEEIFATDKIEQIDWYDRSVYLKENFENQNVFI